MQNIQCHLLRKQRGHILVKRFCANLVILTSFTRIRIDSYDTAHFVHGCMRYHYHGRVLEPKVLLLQGR